ncbi:MAG: hypothetical protein IJZ47_08575 [Oscillospiraceae bacterium]|nr:hypothetical protein [Oscillospiraceae bacterium]
MKVKATVSFSGTVTMAKGDAKDIKEGPVLNDLLKAGYVEKIEDNTDKKSAAKTKGGDSGEAK